MVPPAPRRPVPRAGSRVVLRYSLPPGSVPSQTDVLGTLVELSPRVRVRDADGSEVAVDPGRVVVLKSVPPKPVRTSAIRALERAIALAPGGEAEWVAGWVARRSDAGGPLDDEGPAGAGRLPGAGRLLDVSAATPLADASMPEGDYFHDLLGEDTLAALASWYADRGLPLTLRLPDRLARPPGGWEAFGEHVLLTAALPLGSAPAETGSADGAGTADMPDAASARIAEAPDGTAWAVLAPARDAAGSHIVAACRAAHRSGAERAVLAVPDAGGEALDAAARGLGFADHHRARFVRLRRR